MVIEAQRKWLKNAAPPLEHIEGAMTGASCSTWRIRGNTSCVNHTRHSPCFTPSDIMTHSPSVSIAFGGIAELPLEA